MTKQELKSMNRKHWRLEPEPKGASLMRRLFWIAITVIIGLVIFGLRG